MQRDLAHAAEGLLGGVAGTLMMARANRFNARLPERMQPPEVTQNPGEFVVSRIERAVGRRLPERLHGLAVRHSRWPYGVLFPTLFGAIGQRLVRLERPSHAALAGALLGIGVWAIGYLGWLPATGLVRPIHRQPPGRTISSLAAHAAYGIAAVMPIYLIERRRSRRRFLERLIS
jgi:hypothetical protein